MTKDSPPGPARRVVTGLTENGESTVVTDQVPAARLLRPGGATITEIWRAERLPARCDDAGPLSADMVVSPAAQGLAVRVCTFPPDSEMDAETSRSYAASLAGSYGTDRQTALSPMHRTNTIDVLTVISGELWLVTETGETVVRQGESVVQRGTMHAWSNRTDRATSVVAVMMAAEPD